MVLLQLIDGLFSLPSPVQSRTRLDKKSGEQCTSNCTDPSPARFGQSWCVLARIIGTDPPGKTPLEQPFHRLWCLRQGQRALRTLTQGGSWYRGTNRRLGIVPSRLQRAKPPSESTSPPVHPAAAPENGRRDFHLEARMEGLILQDWNSKVETALGKSSDCCEGTARRDRRGVGNQSMLNNLTVQSFCVWRPAAVFCREGE